MAHSSRLYGIQHAAEDQKIIEIHKVYNNLSMSVQPIGDAAAVLKKNVFIVSSMQEEEY